MCSEKSFSEVIFVEDCSSKVTGVHASSSSCESLSDFWDSLISEFDADPEFTRPSFSFSLVPNLLTAAASNLEETDANLLAFASLSACAANAKETLTESKSSALLFVLVRRRPGDDPSFSLSPGTGPGRYLPLASALALLSMS